MATYNRAQTLRDTIACLDAQTLAPEDYEVIIVDDGSADDTRKEVGEAMGQVRFALRFLSHDNQGPGYTQNRGLREARAPLAMLMADDILLDAGALGAHLEMHEQHPDPRTAVLGRVVQSPKLVQSVFLRIWDPFRFDSFEGLEALPYYLFWACNVSFDREFMLTHGMFREEMGRAGAAAHEDVELGYRLHRRGMRLYFASGALGYHYHIENLAGAMQRGYQRGLNFGEFHKRVPEPEIVVRYHVLSFSTIGDHVHALRSDRRRYLIGADRNPLALALRYALRFTLFNFVTVRLLWLPLASAAEHSPLLAPLMHRDLYRGLISWRFFCGVRDAKRIYGSKGAGVTSAG
jgi:glycosyltransferase involved in cell wall biosynthesis